MKSPLLLASFGILMLFFACKTTQLDNEVVIPPTNDVVVDSHTDVGIIVDTMVASSTDMPTQTLSMVQYYILETNEENEEVYTEKIVEGTATFSSDKEGNDFMKILVTATQKIINTKKMTHPVLMEEVYVDWGGMTQSRER